jgi:hypothetical protein
MENYGNDGQQRADCENCGDNVTVSPLQERSIALTWVLLVETYGGKLWLTGAVIIL